MPIGVPRIIYCWGEELPAQWTDIYNFIFRRRMVFLMQYLDDELCNQICGLLINIHMEDRSKEMEKKEMERSGVFKSNTKPTSTKSTQSGRTPESTSFYNKKSRSMEDLLNADEDLGIDEVDKLEQYTLQKITTEWLNWNAQFFDYSDEPYLYYLAELLSKDFNNSPAQTGQKTNENSEISLLLNMLKKRNANNVKNFQNRGNIQMGEVYSPFRTNANFSSSSNMLIPEGKDATSLQVRNDFKQEILFKNNLFLGKKAAKKHKLLQMFQNYQNLSNSLNQDKSHKNISNLLSNLAQNDFSSKLSSSTHFIKSSETMLGQRNLRREFNLENHFSSNLSTNLNSQVQKFKSFNYLNSSTFSGDSSQSEFRDYYRKQTERTLMEEESKKVFVIINSFGGSVGNGITVHDALQFIKAGSLTLALGVAASAASLALAGGTIGERYVTEGCHVMIHQPECLTSDHNVLTSRGWIPIANVTLQDKVAVLNKNGEMSYEHPTKVHKFDYEGPMYEVKTPEVDLFVTPNHRMYVNTLNSSKEQKYKLIEASSIYRKKVRYKNNAIWNKPDYQFILPEIVKLIRAENIVINEPSTKPDMDSWLIFFGLWVAEGHITKVMRKTYEDQDQKQNYITKITQVKEDAKVIIEKILDRLDYNYVYNGKQFEIKNQQLWLYLNSLDKEVVIKRLPNWVWELSSKQCQILLNGLILGNGHVNKNDGTVHYFALSEDLASDICRLALHAGFAASMNLENVRRSNQRINDREIQANNLLPLWHVKIVKTSFYPCANDYSNTILSEEVNTKSLNNNFAFQSKAKATNTHLIINKSNSYTNVAVLNKSSISTNVTSLGMSKLMEKNITINDFVQGGLNPSFNNKQPDDHFVYYKGPVYCLTVPNSVFYVQRNGKGVWTGNSALQGQASDIWIDSQEIMKIRLDVAEIYSLSTYRPRHKILRDLDRDFYLTATETIQYGLADEIATNEVMQSIVELTHQAWDVHDSTQERLLDSRARIVGDSAQTQESTG